MNNKATQGFRAAILAAAAFLATAAWPGGAPTCAQLCGHWQLDAGSAPNVEAIVDAALATYDGPRRQPRERMPDTIEGADRVRMERTIGPIDDRPSHDELRSELLRMLRTPERLEIERRGADVLIGGPPAPPRRFSPDVPHARVDVDGTATIRCVLKDNRLTVTESYNRRHRSSEVYSVERSGGVLKVTRELRRPGLKAVRVEAHYRPAASLELQSPQS